MARAPRRTAGAQSASRTRLNIPADVLALLSTPKKVGGPCKKWPDWHDDAIREFWGERSVRQISIALKRSRDSVIARAVALGLEERK